MFYGELEDLTPVSIPTCDAHNHLCAFGGGKTQVDALARVTEKLVQTYCSALYNEDELIYADYNSIRSQAIHPHSFPLFSAYQYTQSGFEFSPYHVDNVITWRSAYSLKDDCALFVPATFVYMPFQPRLATDRLMIPQPTGLGCGDTLEEAISRGICDIVAKDSFMLTWLLKIHPPKVNFKVERLHYWQCVANEVLKRQNADLYVYDITTDIGLPTLLTVALAKSAAPPFVTFGLGSSLDPAEALDQALEELVENDWMLHISKSEDVRLQLYNEDHVQWERLEYIGENFDQLDFLLNPPFNRPLNDISTIPNNDGTLQSLASQILAKDLDILIADLTPDFLSEHGLCVVKVIIPGMQPMEVEHGYTHMGGERLYTYSDAFPVSINTTPHPFPIHSKDMAIC